MAKTASLLADGLGRLPGERAAVLLPVHWQAAVAVLGAWRAGLGVQLGDPAGVDVAFADQDALPVALAADAADVIGLSLSWSGAPLADLPPGVTDYASEVRAYADVFPAQPLPGPALLGAAEARSAAALADAAVAAAGQPGLGPDAVVLTVAPYDGVDALLAGLLAPLAAGGRVVLCRHLRADALPGRIATERVTALVGLDAADLPRLDPPG